MNDRVEFTLENKFRWISRIYFSVTDRPNWDVNPFDEMDQFLSSKVGDLTWGKTPSDRVLAKKSFTKAILGIFELYDFGLDESVILADLEKESLVNRDVVTHWAATATFPEN